MIRQIVSLLVFVALLASCSKQPTNVQHNMYFWRTTLHLTEGEKRWMDSMDVKTLYLRLFDVVEDKSEKQLGMRPNATIRGLSKTALDSIAVKDVVPVVFISPGLIKKGDEAKMVTMATLLLSRIDQMFEKNGMAIPHEVQIDYDWTKSNQKCYFMMLKAMADELHKQKRTLSTTIRLHQLAMEAPPADRGVLMLYNTGRVQDFNEQNSILSKESVAPYMRHLAGYSLPLSLALPRFKWNVVFRQQQFAFLVPELPLTDTARYEQIDATHWRSVSYQSVPANVAGALQSTQRIQHGDIIRHEESSDSLNEEMIQLMSRERTDIVQEVIFYR